MVEEPKEDLITKQMVIQRQALDYLISLPFLYHDPQIRKQNKPGSFVTFLIPQYRKWVKRLRQMI